MRSSGSTRSRRPESSIPLLLVIAGEDHPKACTGRKLVRAGLVREVSPGRRPSPTPLLLDPHADRPLSAADRGIAGTRGLLGVDCSWNRLRVRGGYPLEIRWLESLPERRRLPWLVAGNPQHFGRLGELNTAEAFAASLFVLGEPERARSMMSRFAGGPGFFEVNQRLLSGYAECRSETELREREVALFSSTGPSVGTP